MEKLHGKANRIWVMDRGMVSEDNIAFPRKDQRRYIVGTPKRQLRRFESVEPGAAWMMSYGVLARDSRDPARIKHPVEEMVSQRVYGLALGYEDVNDHEQLRDDALPED